MDWFFVERSPKRALECSCGVPSCAVKFLFDGELNLGWTLLNFLISVLLDFLVLIVNASLNNQRLLGARQTLVMI